MSHFVAAGELMTLRDLDSALPYEVAAWLRTLEAAQVEETEDYPAGIRKRLLYVLDRDLRGGVAVHLQSIELRTGGAEFAKHHSLAQMAHAAQPPKFLRPSDHALLRRLAAFGTAANVEVLTTLRDIVATGRGRWGAWSGPTLTEGAPVAGSFAWTMADDGSQRPTIALPGALVTLALAAPWYADPETGALGPIDTGLPDRLARTMLAAPALPPASAPRVRDEIGRRLPGRDLPAPAPVAPPERLRGRLEPRLLLTTGDVERMPWAPYGRPVARETVKDAPIARLGWGYGPVSLAFGAQRDVTMHDGRLVQVSRDQRGEMRARERLRTLGFEPRSYGGAHGGDFVLARFDARDWFDFIRDDVPRLAADGWRVDVADAFPLRVAPREAEFAVEVREHPSFEGSGIDWFEFDLGVIVDGERVNIVPALLQVFADPAALKMLLERDPQSGDTASLLLPLPGGKRLAVSVQRLLPIMSTLLELFAGAAPGSENGAIRLSRHNAGDLALLEDATANAGMRWNGGDALRDLGRQLRAHGAIPDCPAPAGFGAQLRPYQARGLAWLQFLRTAGLGGVLADDMGLGKTVQTLAHLAVEQAAGRLRTPALVICPTSLVPNWRAETARFAPGLRTLVLHGPDRAGRFADIGEHDLVVTTYPLLARDHARLAEQDWHIVVLDEAQTIKNPQAATSQLARTLRAGQRLCLSGTPIENHLGELWSLFDFLMPGFLGNRQAFGRRFRTPIEKNGDGERQAMLAARVAPFLLRRTKQEVAADLPPKTDIAETVEMGDGQRAIYESIRLAMHAKVRAAIAQRGLAGSGIVILEALLKMRQACCDPRLLKLATAKAARARSAKLDRLLEMLPELLDEGRRVLLFSQFTSMLALIEDELARLEIPYVLLTGDTRDRATPVARFQRGEVPLFLVSLKAGGTGLNLTAADTVIHYDPWWNPAVEDQATDRAHRIGQDKPVFVHKLMTAGTIEEKMETLKRRKQALAAGILGRGASATLALTEADLETLFAPAGAA